MWSGIMPNPCFSEKVTFGLMSAEEMKKQAHLHVVSKLLYHTEGTRRPVAYSVLDHRMVGFTDSLSSGFVFPYSLSQKPQL